MFQLKLARIIILFVSIIALVWSFLLGIWQLIAFGVAFWLVGKVINGKEVPSSYNQVVISILVIIGFVVVYYTQVSLSGLNGDQKFVAQYLWWLKISFTAVTLLLLALIHYGFKKLRG